MQLVATARLYPQVAQHCVAARHNHTYILYAQYVLVKAAFHENVVA